MTSKARLRCAVVLASAALADERAKVINTDLQQRLVDSLHQLPAPDGRSSAEAQRAPLRARLEAATGLSNLIESGSSTGSLYLPVGNAAGPAPAILLALAHEDPAALGSPRFVASLVQLGFVVLTLDLSEKHKRIDQLYAGVTPQGLMQAQIRAGLRYLSGRPDVDRKRIGLAGTGLATTVAAGINPEFAAVVLSNGAPDLEKEILNMSGLKGEQLPDSCLLISGLARIASAEQLLALIAPRPALAIGPHQPALEYATNLYFSFGVPGAIRDVPADEGNTAAARVEAYRWLSYWLKGVGLDSFAESDAGPLAVAETRLPDFIPSAAPAHRTAVTRDALFAMLGEALPKGFFGFRLNWAVTRVSLATQKGFALPTIVLRPGPQGDDPEVGTLVVVADAGAEAVFEDDVMKEALRRNWMVWIIDPRGMGAFKSDAPGLIFAWSLLLGENFAWRQGLDVRRIVDEIGRHNQSHRGGVYAVGPNSTLVAAYVAALTEDDNPVWIAVKDSVPSLTPESVGGKLPLFAIPFAGSRVFDIADLMGSAKPKIIHVTDLAEFLNSDW